MWYCSGSGRRHFSCANFTSTLLLFLVIAVSGIIPGALSQQRNRFALYWNVPSTKCYTAKVDIQLQKYGFQFNDKQDFHGNQMNTFYESSIGLYPSYKSPDDPKSAINGGLPQLVNMTTHLLKAERDIDRIIPDKNFAGLAVLDFEAWRPEYSMNWGSKRIYRTESIRLILEEFPYLSDKAAQKLAAEQFNKAAFNFMVETVRLGIRLRPKARWGFYGFPYCNYNAGTNGEYECNNAFKKYNDKLTLMLEKTTALFPSIYLRDSNSTEINFRYIQAILKETKRITSSFTTVKPAYAFTKMEYDPYKNIACFYDKGDLCSSVKQSSELGLQGIIVWSTSKGMDVGRCQLIADYFNILYGPYAKAVQDNANKCAAERCSEHGHCSSDPQKKCALYSLETFSKCECDSPFTGQQCEVNRKFKFSNNWTWHRRRRLH